MLLDVCTATKDALLHMKECSRELQSIVRRRRQGQVKLTLEVKKSLTSKKVVRKSIFKDLENLKGHHANKCNPSMINKEYQIVNLLKYKLNPLIKNLAKKKNRNSLGFFLSRSFFFSSQIVTAIIYFIILIVKCCFSMCTISII
ncbi:uncharacterized protein DS421_3g64830 [Arachis hypogaea]|nr:uncharacterized protein DS421_3g64830 [Arachis hypogaea]